MVKFENVNKTYGEDIVGLKDINLHIKPKEFVSIVGQSGAGKSTMVKLLIAEEQATEGKVIIGGWDITHLRKSRKPILRRQIGVVFQDFKLLPQKTVFENVAFAAEVCGEKRKRIKEIVPKVLEIVGLEDKLDRYPKQLSGGERQRVVIARSLIHRPKLLIADEPTGNLDSLNTKEIIDLLLRINNFGTTVILVTHNKDVVNSLRKRVIVLSEGKISSDKERGRYVI
ncbi:cell division ATP-binding protein FtsE [Candidatus Falkowbacteria bacterium]|jgi:cell division transport system ATP-binding protein|nr:cell division ATP-binding protein FtsE [Candidatus Falkowbacteria bacterium]MBT4432912.1 cell division ATP-binding protein FtsE [Candidatus Falkowbacteria bacterium]